MPAVQNGPRLEYYRLVIRVLAKASGSRPELIERKGPLQVLDPKAIDDLDLDTRSALPGLTGRPRIR